MVVVLLILLLWGRMERSASERRGDALVTCCDEEEDEEERLGRAEDAEVGMTELDKRGDVDLDDGFELVTTFSDPEEVES